MIESNLYCAIDIFERRDTLCLFSSIGNSKYRTTYLNPSGIGQDFIGGELKEKSS
jgi:hypothetical protein